MTLADDIFDRATVGEVDIHNLWDINCLRAFFDIVAFLGDKVNWPYMNGKYRISRGSNFSPRHPLTCHG